jgi:hypothetical protein
MLKNGSFISGLRHLMRQRRFVTVVVNILVWLLITFLFGIHMNFLFFYFYISSGIIATRLGYFDFGGF